MKEGNRSTLAFIDTWRKGQKKDFLNLWGKGFVEPPVHTLGVWDFSAFPFVFYLCNIRREGGFKVQYGPIAYTDFGFMDEMEW